MIGILKYIQILFYSYDEYLSRQILKNKLITIRRRRALWSVFYKVLSKMIEMNHVIFENYAQTVMPF